MSKVIDGIVKDIKTVPEKLKAEIGKVDKKKFFLMNLPYFLTGYFCDKIAWLWRVSPGQNASDKILATINGLEDLFANPLPSFFPKDLLIGIGCGIALRLVVYFKAKNAKKFRQGVEYGSARWGTAKDIEPYVDPVFENNVLLTETERLMMSGRPKEPKYARKIFLLSVVLVTDQNGKTYEKNRYVKCFDFDKPTLNAAVSDGLLSIQAHDTASGIKAIYVNGYEFTEITNGVLNIRLQQFDAGYQYFTIQAMDNAGNMSEVYKTANPYYTDPEVEDSNESNPAEQLPVNAEATNPSSATAQVTEHAKTDSQGNQIVSNNAGSGSDKKTSDSDTEVDEEKGKEFYTIQTANEKVFYLIIDRDGDEEMVYFLTEISENDLLNTTTENSETLPKNSAALESAVPVSGGALNNNNVEGEQAEGTENAAQGDVTEDNPEGTEVPEEEKPEENSMTTYIILGMIAVAVIGFYYFKVIRKKEDFLDEDEEEDDEEYEEEEEENEDAEDDFFDQTDEEVE